MLMRRRVLRLSPVRGGSPSYFMRRFCTTSDTCRHKIGNISGGGRKVCILNAKETAGRRKPKRSRQKPSAITLRIG